MVERRFFVDPEDIRGEDLAVVRGAEHHHLSRVLRLKAGDEVSVFDGAGRGYGGIVQSMTAEESLVRLTRPDDRAVEPALHLTLAQGIPHHDKMDLIVQKATEVGVSEFVPIIAERTTVRVERSGGWKRLERWRRVARESARQSGRLVVPRVCEPAPLREFLEAEPRDPARHRFILCPLLDSGNDGQAEHDGYAEHAERRERDVDAPGLPELGRPPASATLAVGPEGGWSPEEVSLATRCGFTRLALGPRVMRTETAGIVGAALILFLAGDMGPASRRRGPI